MKLRPIQSFVPGSVITLLLASVPDAAAQPVTARAGDTPPHEAIAEPVTPPGYPAQGVARFDRDKAPTIEVLRAKTGHLLVRPTLNGKSAGWFIFDTGAGICVLSEPHVGEHTLRESGTLDAVGVGATQAKLWRADSLELGPLTLTDLPLIALDLSFLKQHLGEEICGVIGYGLLSKCVAEIDLATPAIAIHDSATYELAGATWTPADLDRFIPVVTARFETHEGRFTLDTGANDAVSFHAKAVESLALLENRMTTDSKLGGVGGYIATKRGRLASFDLGGIVTNDLEATFEIERKPNADTAIAGNIGVGLLKQCILTTDYAQRRLAFVPRAAATPPAGSR